MSNIIKLNYTADEINEKLGKVDDIVADGELSTESENPVQNKVITEEFGKYLKSATTTTGASVYCRINGTNMNIARTSVAKQNDETNPASLVGLIPMYTVDRQLTTGTNPTTDYSCINLKYFNANKGTKLYKHSALITVTTKTLEDLGNGEVYEYGMDNYFEVTFFSTNSNTNNVSVSVWDYENRYGAIEIPFENAVSMPALRFYVDSWNSTFGHFDITVNNSADGMAYVYAFSDSPYLFGEIVNYSVSESVSES